MAKGLFLSVMLLLLGCTEYGPHNESQVQGFGKPIADTLHLPALKTAAELADAIQRVQVRILSPEMRLLSQASAKVHLQKIISNELVDSGGMPRTQVETILKTVLASEECGGAPCWRVFDLEKREISSFLDGMRQKLLVRKTESEISETGHYALLLASLTPESVIIMGQKIGEQSGSNLGGFYKGLDGIERYVKFYPDQAQAQGEHLAGMIYRDLGIPAPKTLTFFDGNDAFFASEIVSTARPLEGQVTKDDAREILKGFVADVLTANWDVFGMTFDNIVKGGDKKYYRIDNGGAFLMRAKNGRKPTALLHKITEWDVFMDASKNPSYAALLNRAALSRDEFMVLAQDSFKAIETLRSQYGDWGRYVSHKMPAYHGPDAQSIVSMLEQRTALLREKIANLP